WTQQIDVALGYRDRIEHVRTQLNAAAVEVAGVLGRPAPLFLLPHRGGTADGKIHPDRASRDWLSANIFRIGDPLTRGSAWLALWDSMLDGDVAPARLLDLMLESLPLETDELNIEEILRELRIVYWRFLPDASRQAIAPRVE